MTSSCSCPEQLGPKWLRENRKEPPQRTLAHSALPWSFQFPCGMGQGTLPTPLSLLREAEHPGGFISNAPQAPQEKLLSKREGTLFPTAGAPCRPEGPMGGTGGPSNHLDFNFNRFTPNPASLIPAVGVSIFETEGIVLTLRFVSILTFISLLPTPMPLVGRGRGGQLDFFLRPNKNKTLSRPRPAAHHVPGGLCYVPAVTVSRICRKHLAEPTGRSQRSVKRIRG